MACGDIDGCHEPARLRNQRAKPRVVCLCGSTRFYEQFQVANYEETMAGRIVLSVGFYQWDSKRECYIGFGCHECGYQGVRREHMILPVRRELHPLLNERLCKRLRAAVQSREGDTE